MTGTYLKSVSTMDTSNTHSNYFDDIHQCDSSTQILHLVYQFGRKFGACKLFYFHLPHIGALDYNEQYFAHYPERTSQSVAPSTRACVDTIVDILSKIRLLDAPVLVKHFLEWSEMTPVQKERMQRTTLAENLNGIVIPVHSANGRSGCMMIGFEDMTQEPTTDDIRQLGWASDAAHRQFCKLKKSNEAPSRKLTDREREIIKWVARGKSNSVIAEIIGISQHTVNGYIRSIYLKTGTSDRTGATLRCIGEGLLDL